MGVHREKTKLIYSEMKIACKKERIEKKLVWDGFRFKIKIQKIGTLFRTTSI